MADATGAVHSTAPGIARRANLGLADTEKALEVFESPDGHSRSLNEEGRRIKRIDGGYQIVNYEKYRERDYTAAERQKRWRDKQKRNAVTPVTRNVTSRKQKQSTEAEVLIPSGLDSVEFRSAWKDWIQHRKEIKKPLTPMSIKQQLTHFSEIGVTRSIAAIRHTIGKGWQGLAEENATNQKSNSANPRITGTALEGTAKQYRGVGKIQ